MTEINVSNELEGFKIKLIEEKGHCTITIDGYSGESEKVIIPASFGNISVTAIGNLALFGCTKIKNVILPEGIIYIDDNAFSGCTGLENISFPKSLACIGSAAFENCVGLKDISLPENLTSIGDWAFRGCKGLKNISLPENLNCIEYEAFENCEQLTKITIPKGVLEIGNDIFSGCINLNEISVDQNNPVYASVDGVLFNKDLTTLILYPTGKKGDYTVPDSVVDTTDNAFNNCKNLTRITFPKEFMRVNIMSGCEQLAAIVIDDDNTVNSSVDGVLYNKEGSELLKCPQGSEITKLIVPDKVGMIWDGAFFNCKNLTEIILPEGLTLIGDEVFSGCEKLTAIILPMSLRYLGKYVFARCSNLETITLSRKTKMGYKALGGFSGKLCFRD